MKDHDISTSWETDIQNWTNLSTDSAKFYLAQAEARLNGTIETSKIITTRTELLSTISIAITSSSIYYLFNGNTPYIKAVSFFSILLMILISTYLLRNWKKYEVATLGEEPRKIFTSKFVDADFNSEEQFLNLVFQIMEVLQFKIDLNHQTNIHRQRNITIAKRLFLAFPLVFVLAVIYQFFCGYQLLWERPF